MKYELLSTERRISWKQVIIAALICGLITGVILDLEPFLENTSLFNIGTDFEFWIFAAILIIYHTESPLEAAEKTFVFFLISQPLVYLVKAPFSPLGLGEFKFYKGWFIWTLLTFPGAIIAWYIRRKDWISIPIFLVAVFLLSAEFGNHLQFCVNHFPRMILSVLFILWQIYEYIRTFSDRKKRTVFAVLCVLLLAGLSVVMWIG